MSFTLFKIVRTRNKRVESLLERIAIAQERIADATERLAPEVEEAGEMKVVEISPVLEPTSEQEKLDEEGIPQDAY